VTNEALCRRWRRFQLWRDHLTMAPRAHRGPSQPAIMSTSAAILIPPHICHAQQNTHSESHTHNSHAGHHSDHGTQQISTIIRVYHKSIFKSANSLINSIISLLSIISLSKLHGHANKIKPKVGSNIQYSKLHCSLNSSMCPHGEPGSIHGRRRWAE